MNIRKQLEALNELLQICTLGDFHLSKNEPHRTFGVGQKDALSIIGNQNCGRFEQLVSELLDSTASIRETLSTTTFTEALVPLLREKKRSESVFTREESEDFWNRLSGRPCVEHRVLRPIFGITLATPDPLPWGFFTIFDRLKHSHHIFGANHAPDILGEEARSPGFFIECKVPARDQHKALEIADALYLRFELMIRFLIGYRTDRFDVAILNHTGWRTRQNYIVTDQTLSMGRSGIGAIEQVPLDNDYFCKGDTALQVMELTRSPGSGLKRRVLRCIEWTGQALADPSPASAFIKAATALEVLFSAAEKGIITPSIMAQISESCAHLLGNSPERCVELEALVKRLYGVRSAVVHSGSDDISLHDLNTFIHIARTVALALLSSAKYRDIESIDKLHASLKLKKYSTAQ